jgi:hypothetical protein
MVGIYKGADLITALKLGAVDVSEVYYGAVKLWPVGPVILFETPDPAVAGDVDDWVYVSGVAVSILLSGGYITFARSSSSSSSTLRNTALSPIIAIPDPTKKFRISLSYTKGAASDLMEFYILNAADNSILYRSADLHVAASKGRFQIPNITNLKSNIYLQWRIEGQVQTKKYILEQTDEVDPYDSGNPATNLADWATANGTVSQVGSGIQYTSTLASLFPSMTVTFGITPGNLYDFELIIGSAVGSPPALLWQIGYGQTGNDIHQASVAYNSGVSLRYAVDYTKTQVSVSIVSASVCPVASGWICQSVKVVEAPRTLYLEDYPLADNAGSWTVESANTNLTPTANGLQLTKLVSGSTASSINQTFVGVTGKTYVLVWTEGPSAGIVTPLGTIDIRNSSNASMINRTNIAPNTMNYLTFTLNVGTEIRVRYNNNFGNEPIGSYVTIENWQLFEIT